MYEANCDFHCSYVQNYRDDDVSTHDGLDLTKMTMGQLYQHFSLEPSTIEFIGHALALYENDDYIHQPALPTVEKVALYHESLVRFEGTRSPYIYPRYGLGELPQVWSLKQMPLKCCGLDAALGMRERLFGVCCITKCSLMNPLPSNLVLYSHCNGILCCCCKQL